MTCSRPTNWGWAPAKRGVTLSDPRRTWTLDEPRTPVALQIQKQAVFAEADGRGVESRLAGNEEGFGGRELSGATRRSTAAGTPWPLPLAVKIPGEVAAMLVGKPQRRFGGFNLEGAVAGRDASRNGEAALARRDEEPGDGEFGAGH